MYQETFDFYDSTSIKIYNLDGLAGSEDLPADFRGGFRR